MQFPGAYKVEGVEAQKFVELDDEHALKIVALIYNVKHEEWEDGIARNLALEQYMALLKKRKSEYVEKSGVFDIKYDKVNLRKWKDADLVNLYRKLLPRSKDYYIDASAELNDRQNAERILYLTALNTVSTEINRRKNTRNAIEIASQLLVGALTVALSFI